MQSMKNKRQFNFASTIPKQCLQGYTKSSVQRSTRYVQAGCNRYFRCFRISNTLIRQPMLFRSASPQVLENDDIKNLPFKEILFQVLQVDKPGTNLTPVSFA